MRRLLVLFNPQAHAGSDPHVVASFERKLRAVGFDAVLRPLGPSCDLDALVAEQTDACDAVVIGGGDGSIRAVLPAVLKSRLPLAIWPLGTANDFARSLEIEDEDDCVQALAGWTQRPVDVSEVNGHYFINNVTLGLPLEAALRITPELKKRLGVFATVALLPALWAAAKPFQVEFDADGRKERRTIVAALIGNGEYEGGFPIRYTSLADGKLHAVICNAGSRWALIPILFNVATKRMAQSRRIEIVCAERVSIETAPRKRIGVDGDAVSETPAIVTLHPSALMVFRREAGSK